jgi:hypothetical protein
MLVDPNGRIVIAGVSNFNIFTGTGDVSLARVIGDVEAGLALLTRAAGRGSPSSRSKAGSWSRRRTSSPSRRTSAAAAGPRPGTSTATACPTWW